MKPVNGSSVISGRFTRQDAAGQGANLYNYEADNLVNAVDPGGASFWDFTANICVGLCISIGTTLGGQIYVGFGAGPELAAAVNGAYGPGSEGTVFSDYLESRQVRVSDASRRTRVAPSRTVAWRRR